MNTQEERKLLEIHHETVNVICGVLLTRYSHPVYMLNDIMAAIGNNCVQRGLDVPDFSHVNEYEWNKLPPIFERMVIRVHTEEELP